MLNTDTVQITNEMLRMISGIDEFKGAWDSLSRLGPDRLDAIRQVATIESIGSSTRIEGSRLSDREVEELLSNIRIVSFTDRDEQEVAGYASVMETVISSWRHMPLTENIICQLHRDLLIHSHKDARHRGSYKTSPNQVEAYDAAGRSVGVVIETASPFDTPRLMSELVGWLHEQIRVGDLHPLLIVALFVVVFLEIHPFQDGNGRLSRILTTLIMLQSGYSYVPYSSMESVIEQNKESYYLALRRTQCTIRSDEPDWQPWLMFFLQSLESQKSRLEKKLERERIAIGSLPDLSERIIVIVGEHGRVSVSDLARITGASRNTIKDHLRRLVDAGHLALHGAGRGSWYTLS